MLPDLLDPFGKGEGLCVHEVSDFGVAGPFPDGLHFPLVGCRAGGGLAVAELTAEVISDLESKVVPWL